MSKNLDKYVEVYNQLSAKGEIPFLRKMAYGFEKFNFDPLGVISKEEDKFHKERLENENRDNVTKWKKYFKDNITKLISKDEFQQVGIILKQLSDELSYEFNKTIVKAIFSSEPLNEIIKDENPEKIRILGDFFTICKTQLKQDFEVGLESDIYKNYHAVIHISKGIKSPELGMIRFIDELATQRLEVENKLSTLTSSSNSSSSSTISSSSSKSKEKTSSIPSNTPRKPSMDIELTNFKEESTENSR